VQRLAEIQSDFRDAVVDGNINALSQTLTGGRLPEKRLAIHQRNYRVSLTDSLLTRFPATHWLLGTQFISEAAKRFVREYPPQVPCIAEYGAGFPEFLGRCAPHLLYVREFAQLEWLVGKAAIDVDRQTGVSYLHASWPVDQLLKIYLSEEAPDEFKLEPEDVWMEVRGARGEFQVIRLSKEEFAQREAGNA
jgi:hypothetical protein